jgi:phosphoribosylformimino-5-aminoimidazole carboxamide ribotide isomerase
MIIPCIDLMDGKAVQLVRGRRKALETDAMEMVRKFKAHPLIHVIDLDAALGNGDNDKLVARICKKRACRVGGGIRTLERVKQVASVGAEQIIIGTAAFTESEVNRKFLAAARRAVGKKRLVVALDTARGRIVVRGWRSRTGVRAEDVMPDLEAYCSGFLCTYVDKEGMMQGTSLRWFRRLRKATQLPIIAAGGITTQHEVEALEEIGMDAAVGMAIYTGKLSLERAC